MPIIRDDDDEPLSAYKARLQHDSRPLIEQVNNQWKGEEEKKKTSYIEDEIRELGFCDLEDDASCPNVTRDVVSSRRFRRMLVVAVVLGLGLYYIWSVYLRPPMEEDWAYKEGFVRQENGTYGIAEGGDLDEGLVRIQDLDRDLLPGGPMDPKGERRLVFVGDVHGCKKELVRLLEEVGFSEEKDHLVLVGDVVSKGPDNVGVLDELIRLNATSVRGNHEDRLLQAAKSSHQLSAISSKGATKDAALLKELKPQHIDYLHSMPLMLHIPALPQALPATKKKSSPIGEHILVVHAGLVPGVPLSKQDPYYVMNMRSINRRTHVPSAVRASGNKNEKPWFDVWGWYNERIFKKQSFSRFNLAFQSPHYGGIENGNAGWSSLWWKNFWGQKKSHPKPQTVIYGHDSKAGLQIWRFSKGLDSGCVGGGQLTALVLDARGEWELKSVRCKNYRD